MTLFINNVGSNSYYTIHMDMKSSCEDDINMLETNRAYMSIIDIRGRNDSIH